MTTALDLTHAHTLTIIQGTVRPLEKAGEERGECVQP